MQKLGYNPWGNIHGLQPLCTPLLSSKDGTILHAKYLLVNGYGTALGRYVPDVVRAMPDATQNVTQAVQTKSSIAVTLRGRGATAPRMTRIDSLGKREKVRRRGLQHLHSGHMAMSKGDILRCTTETVHSGW